ncbi:MAG: preprotein translocase subunit SecA [Candidatus Cloacimonetes bacterium]|nr:preprotein translocase subunit SecA [Candidatus Cloacimonadota bacterium]
MFKKIAKKVFGDRYQRELKKIQPILNKISEIYPTLEALSDEELREKIQVIENNIHEELSNQEQELEKIEKEYQLEPDENKKNSLGNEIDRRKEKLKKHTQSVLDDNLPEVFAIVKDTCRRLMGYTYDVRGREVVWNMIPFDVQLIGGIVLHQGTIAEMATGEGKTLVAIIALFLNSLLGRGVHLITVNDYLAQRDSEWMNPVFEFHNLKMGCIINGMSSEERNDAYKCDVTYGTNSEFGFDYLRDNMAVSVEQLNQRKHQFAIVDEVDSVLVDEARTPLIISGPVKESKNYYTELKPIIQKLVFVQDGLVKSYISAIKTNLSKEEWDTEIVGRLLLLASRAAPKNKSFLKLMKESELKKLLLDTEGYHIRDKNMHEIDTELFFVVEEKQNSVELSEKGHDLVSKRYPNLFILERLDDLLAVVEENNDLSYEQKSKRKEKVTDQFLDKNEKLHNIKQLLKSYMLFEKDVDYVVMNNKVMIVDTFTGRVMQGRRFSDGLHQALEAKENVKIEDATQTFATITLQNYFRMYEKLSGMTGTAITEEAEFIEIYNLPVIVIPTNLPISRIDFNDMIFLTKNEKYQAIIDEIEYWHAKNKPVLVGTVSVEVSELLSRLLRRRKIKHNVLNAKQNDREAEIVATAGEAGSITIATNMAGRGTDIKLEETVVSQAKAEYLNVDKKTTVENPYGFIWDGLHVIGTERHESRRIDRQLRGRSGRQGDPGTSRFFLSLEDDLMRMFGSDRIAPMMMKLGLEKGEAIVHPWMTKTVEQAQKRVEAYNFEIRKQLIKYDEVMNQQREVIYNYRKNVLKGYDLKFEIIEMMKDTIAAVITREIGDNPYHEEWPIENIISWAKNNLNVDFDKEELLDGRLSVDRVIENAENILEKKYEARENEMGSEDLRNIERRSLLTVVDDLWRDHLHEMDLLKEGIGLRAYGQKDPLIEYKKESFRLFQDLVMDINSLVTKKVFTTFLITSEQLQSLMKMGKLQHASSSAFQRPANPQKAQEADEPPKLKPRTVDVKIGRNEPCPCGSGKKYKKCCGKITND